MQEFTIHTEYIQLQNVLKILNYIESGGESKLFLQTNEITVNGEKEERRGRKLYDGDVLVIKGTSYIIKNENK